MESKYYAPEIEEFHKGFEFEWFEDQFKKESFGITTDDDLEIIDDEIRERKIIWVLCWSSFESFKR